MSDLFGSVGAVNPLQCPNCKRLFTRLQEVLAHYPACLVAMTPGSAPGAHPVIAGSENTAPHVREPNAQLQQQQPILPASNAQPSLLKKYGTKLMKEYGMLPAGMSMADYIALSTSINPEDRNRVLALKAPVPNHLWPSGTFKDHFVANFSDEQLFHLPPKRSKFDSDSVAKRKDKDRKAYIDAEYAKFLLRQHLQEEDVIAKYNNFVLMTGPNVMQKVLRNWVRVRGRSVVMETARKSPSMAAYAEATGSFKRLKAACKDDESLCDSVIELFEGGQVKFEKVKLYDDLLDECGFEREQPGATGNSCFEDLITESLGSVKEEFLTINRKRREKKVSDTITMILPALDFHSHHTLSKLLDSRRGRINRPLLLQLQR